jgi:4'-phosphopantetheinyl transferase
MAAEGIDVYVLHLATRRRGAEPFLVLLDEAEHRRAMRFRNPADLLSYSAAHALLRMVLSRRAGVEPTELRFSTGRGGKPFLKSGPSFSLSHSRGIVAVAVAEDAELGVDVETVPRQRAAGALVASAFCEDEAALLAATGDEARRQTLFLELWTLKEAFAKAVGQGLAGGLDRVSFAAGPDCPAFRSDAAGNPADWQFAQWSAEDSVLALAARGPDVPRPVRLHVLDEDAFANAPADGRWP